MERLLSYSHLSYEIDSGVVGKYLCNATMSSVCGRMHAHIPLEAAKAAINKKVSRGSTRL